jgi:protein-S-isoprenylcysteine O-methyltransferase Ste14
MYIGAAAVIPEAGLIVSSSSILLLGLAFVLTMHLLVVIHEEPTLADKFGVSYQRYRGLVHRWLIRKPKPNAMRGVG